MHNFKSWGSKFARSFTRCRGKTSIEKLQTVSKDLKNNELTLHCITGKITISFIHFKNHDNCGWRVKTWIVRIFFEQNSLIYIKPFSPSLQMFLWFFIQSSQQTGYKPTQRVTWVSFCWYVPLVSHNPYPIIVNLWPTIDPVLVTFG